MSYIFRKIALLILLLEKINNRLSFYIFRPLFRKCGAGSLFFPRHSSFTYDSIELGENVFIAKGAWFSSGESAPLKIGNNVMFGPNVSIFCGDHDIDQVGVVMRNAKKTSKSSSPVTIGNDVWIGAGSTLLKGVSVGDGAVIGAGAVVSKDVAPYSVVVGGGSKYLKQRFSESDLVDHKLKLNND